MVDAFVGLVNGALDSAVVFQSELVTSNVVAFSDRPHELAEDSREKVLDVEP